MHFSASRNASRLPKRFPVGTTYVVEGRGGEDGHLRVFSRYVVLPGGQRINLGGDFGGPAARRARGAFAGTAVKARSKAAEKRRVEQGQKNCCRVQEPHGGMAVDRSDAGRSPPAPHPQSPGVEPRPL